MENIKMRIEYIPIEYIRPNPYQPRTKFSTSALEELTQSIKEYGVLQPINVRKFSDNSYELIAGERRLRASKMAGLLEIPALINEVVEVDSAIMALIENIQRENLNYIEEAESYNQLMTLHNLTQEQIAKKVGKNQSTVANKLRLLRLHKDVRREVLDNNLSERHARALLRLPDEVLQKEALDSIVKKKLNVKKSEELIEKIRDKVLINNYEEKITKNSRARIKSFINMKIYLNTIKSAFNEVLKTGIKASYQEKDLGDYIEVKIILNKK
ncbi:nucleoid occlusion protein [Alkalibaculum sp. M08DMB]|uniref:Nucleoid occlusion protein n=1 Tax=Alkalibaculum sporogenes TaxID=2655001 RepID=A0A6A7K753_9FIRM|nr:nucleoid occlusion protein [Alkalibaculum sporogenes]MPW25308.1 nucleoid occlusion protein [Alkalibaculum sporogenes]